MIFYVEGLYQLLLVLIPSEHMFNYTVNYVFGINLGMFLVYYTDNGSQVIFATLLQYTWSLFPLIFIYKEEISVEEVLAKTVLAVAFYFLISILGMMVLYMSSL